MAPPQEEKAQRSRLERAESMDVFPQLSETGPRANQGAGGCRLMLVRRVMMPPSKLLDVDRPLDPCKSAQFFSMTRDLGGRIAPLPTVGCMRSKPGITRSPAIPQRATGPANYPVLPPHKSKSRGSRPTPPLLLCTIYSTIHLLGTACLCYDLLDPTCPVFILHANACVLACG